MTDKRIEWIDNIKGIGIILVMMAHAPLPSDIKKEIYTFHVPLFFFISGYLFSKSKDASIRDFIEKRSKTLIIPYFLLSFICYLYWLFKYLTVNIKGANRINILQPLLGTIIAIRDSNWMIHNGTMWFITCLFVSEIIFFIVLKFSKNSNKNIIIYLSVFFIMGFLYNFYIKVNLPWSIDLSFTAVVFYGVGYLAKINKVFYQKNKTWYIIILLLINILTNRFNIMVDMFYNQFGNYILFYLSAISGIGAVVMIIKNFMHSNVGSIRYIGVNSLVFLAFHQAILYPIIDRRIAHIQFFNTDNFIIKLLKGTTYTVIACIILTLTSYFINKYFPVIIGKKKYIHDKQADSAACSR